MNPGTARRRRASIDTSIAPGAPAARGPRIDLARPFDIEQLLPLTPRPAKQPSQADKRHRPPPIGITTVRSILLTMLFAGLLPAIDLTVNSNFATDEDVPLVFSYSELSEKCNVDAARSGFRVMLVSNGSLKIANTISGPWTTDVVPASTIIVNGNFLKYTPIENLNGTNRAFLTIQATDGSSFSPNGNVNIDIAAINDVIFASTGTFTQPSSPKVTEDTPYTFTWQQIRDTLNIVDPDPQAWTLRITAKSSGRLWTGDGSTEITTFPTTLAAGSLASNALRWQADANAYTKDGPPAEPAIDVFTAVAVNTNAPLDESPVVTFSTPVVGVADPLTGVRTTMTSLDPLVITKGMINIFTYAQLRSLVQGTNDVDRIGSLSLQFSDPAIAGCRIRYFANEAPISDQLASPTTPVLVQVESNIGKIHIIPHDGMSIGIIHAGNAQLSVSSSTGPSVPLTDLNLDVHPASIGGTTSGPASAGGSGGCGIGGALSGVISCALIALQICRSKAVR